MTAAWKLEGAALAEEMAAGLRAVADLLVAHPELAEKARYSFDQVNLYVDDIDEIRAFVHAGLAHGAKITKAASEQYLTAELRWSAGLVGLDVFAKREKVCERVVVGTETVEIPDPDAPKITVERDVVEWKCRPILASTEGGAS